MMPELFFPKNVIVQGITGTQGTFHTRNMVRYGTHIVAGTSPNKPGSSLDGIPVYATIADIQHDNPAIDATVIFVPAPFAKAAIIEAIDAEIPLIICITENIPVHDMLYIKQHIAGKPSQLIGPNCPGVLTPEHSLLGIIPAQLAAYGDTAIVSRSGTLTYEAMDALTRRGIGQRYVIGIGGDMVPGTSFTDCLELFQNDPTVKRIVMIGEIGGSDELLAADYIQRSATKPVYVYIAGHTAPPGVQMGHAGAILGNNQRETAAAKTAALAEADTITANSLMELVQKII